MVVTQVDGDPNTTDPQTTVVSDMTIGRPTSIVDPLNRQTQFQYTDGQLTRVTAPEENYVEYSYDSAGAPSTVSQGNNAKL